ncbi:MAG TPA: hemerythrin domain-containing protein [Gammaproteobacteria bacterium]
MKRSPGLRSLSSDHHAALVLARRAAVAAAMPDNSGEVVEAWREIIQRFEAELEPHFRQEEAQLLPALVQAGETSLVQRTLAEHAQMRTLAYHRPRSADTLRQLAELLQAHVRFEERELFQLAQARLPEFSLEPSS